MKTLGSLLKAYRELIPMKLRQVEDATGISNGYLSQLENDKIKQPSANVLYKLSKLYCVELDTLLFAAGIIKEEPPIKWHHMLNGVAVEAGKLTTDEEQALLDYLKYLRFSKK